MRILILFVLLTLQVRLTIAQGVDNLWIMGYDHATGLPYGNTNIDFNTGSPSIYYQNREISFARCSASICDSLGDLLFFTNGFFILNANNDTILNGAYLDTGAVMNSWINIGSPVPQGVFIIPKPKSNSEYYLFHEMAEIADVPNVSQLQPLDLFYSLVDMNADNGKGAVIARQVPVFSDTLFVGGITGVKHANGRDWWVIVHENNSNGFYTVLVTPDSIMGPYLQFIGQQLNFGGNGQSVFSPDGSHFAMYDNLNDLDVYDFDRCSGLLSNYQHVAINDSANAAGVAFSPNSQYIYVSSDQYIYQFDINNSNLSLSQITVAVWDTFYSPNPPFATTFYLAQLAPDGKIYLSTPNGTDKLHVINYPDSVGMSCDVCQHCITLPAYNAFTIPNVPNYFLGSETGSVCDSLTTNMINLSHSVSIKISPNPAQNYFWLSFNSNTLENPLRLLIYNSVGEIILTKELPYSFNSVKVDCNFLISGVYYVTIISENIVGTEKLLIVK